MISKISEPPESNDQAVKHVAWKLGLNWAPLATLMYRRVTHGPGEKWGQNELDVVPQCVTREIWLRLAGYRVAAWVRQPT